MVMVMMVMMKIIAMMTIMPMMTMKMCRRDELRYIDKETRERLLVAFANEVILQLIC